MRNRKTGKGNIWWVRQMRDAEPILHKEKVRRLRRMSRRESLKIFKSLCEAGRLPPEKERRRLEAARMEVFGRVQRALNKLGARE